MIKRYDLVQCACGFTSNDAHMALREAGEFVTHEACEAAIRANVETHAANLAAVEARALRMEQTIARVRDLAGEIEALARMAEDCGQMYTAFAYRECVTRIRQVLEAT